MFRRGISHYLSTHAYGNTETSDLWDAIESVSGEPVRQIMESWIFQGGYPMVEVESGGDPATVVLHQRRFVYSGEPGDTAWIVPVNLRASVGGRVVEERLLLSGPEASCTFPGPVDWVVVNSGGWGFYRTRYSPDLRRRLMGAGPAQVLTPLERLQLLGDTWAALVAGRAELGEWVEIADAVAAEADPDVWGSIGGALHALELMGDATDRDAVRDFARRLTTPAWDLVGWTPGPGEDERVGTARARVLLARGGTGRDASALAEARRRFSAHLGGRSGEDGLSPDIVAVAARLAVTSGGTESWSEALDGYRRAERPQDQLRYLYALAETPDPELRMRTLEMMLGPDVRSQDAPFVIASVMSQPDATGQVWQWISDNWDRIVERFPSTLLVRILEATAGFVDPGVADAVHRFFDSHELPVSTIRTRQMLERMDVNVALAGRLTGAIAPVVGAADPR